MTSVSHAGGPLPSQDALPGAATASAQATQPPAITRPTSVVRPQQTSMGTRVECHASSLSHQRHQDTHDAHCDA